MSFCTSFQNFETIALNLHTSGSYEVICKLTIQSVVVIVANFKDNLRMRQMPCNRLNGNNINNFPHTVMIQSFLLRSSVNTFDNSKDSYLLMHMYRLSK